MTNTNKKLMKERILEFLINKKKVLIDLNKERTRSLEYLNAHFSVEASTLHDEYMNSYFKRHFEIKKQELALAGEKKETSSSFDCESLFLLILSLKPSVVVETGVKYGASTAHILEAMHQNGKGVLYSFDFEQHPDETFPRDFFIPETVKKNWRFIKGNIVNELPKTLETIGQVDLFFHDSLHSFDHMLWEYELIYKNLSEGGLLTSHDVLSIPFQRNAFCSFCKQHGLKYDIFRNLGVAAKEGNNKNA